MPWTRDRMAARAAKELRGGYDEIFPAGKRWTDPVTGAGK